MISKCGEGAQLLYNIAQEGNSVRLFIEQKEDRDNWKDIIHQISNPIPHEDEVVIFDQSTLGHLADRIACNNPTFGGSRWADMLECDRQYGLNVMKMCGIKVPDTQSFNPRQWDDAFKFIKENSKDRYVFKPDGEGLPSKLSYVPSDSLDLLCYLEYVRKAYGNRIDSFVLQKFIEGVIVSTEFWCDGTKFIQPANHTVEVKKLMNDDVGPSTGCSGNLIWPCYDSCTLVNEGVAKIEEMCVSEGYRGCIDLNTIVNEKGLFGLEWTPRFGYDAMPTILQLIDGDVGKLISDCARGQGPKEFPFKNKLYAGGVRLSIPPYPLEPKSTKDVKRVSPNENIPIRGFSKEQYNNIYFLEIKGSEDSDEIVHSLGTGAILVASDSSNDAEDCFSKVYEILDDAKIPDKQYRTDLDKVLPDMCKDVQELEMENANAH